MLALATTSGYPRKSNFFFFPMNEYMNTQSARQTDPSLLEKAVLWRGGWRGLDQDWITYCLANVRGDRCPGLCGCGTTQLCFVGEESTEKP